jgi:hypothetical protein
MNDYTQPVVYDKTKYHLETTEEYGLLESHASHHTLYFLRWLIENDMMSEDFMSETQPLNEYRSNNRTILSLYEWWDCCLIDDMLSDEGNAFAQHYFDFEKGQYIHDYIGLLQGNLPSEFHIDFTDENYAQLKAIIDKRYRQWKEPKKKWWQF